MLTCPLCGDVSVPALHHLMTHIRVMHADEPQFVIQCNLQGCKKTFRKFTVYRNHVYGFHDTFGLQQEPSVPDQPSDSDSQEPPVPYQLSDSDSEEDIDFNGPGV